MAPSRRESTRSIAMIVVAPTAAAAMIAEEPTAPVPKIATDSPAQTFRELIIEPAPVIRPQPSGPSNSSGTSSVTGTTDRTETFAWLANDDCPKKCEDTADPLSDSAVVLLGRVPPKL